MSSTRPDLAAPRATEPGELAASLVGEAWPDAASAFLAELGFTLIDSHSPAGSGSHLLVALRSRPTLRHFDPEAITYYARRADRAVSTTLEKASACGAGAPARITREALWGHVHVTDRLRVENRFLTFGGELRCAVIDRDLTVIDLASPGPIVRWGGHSQGTDDLSTDIGAFFGRLMVPVDCTPGAETDVDAQPPLVLYAAFLQDVRKRRRSVAAQTIGIGSMDRWLWAEARRVSEDAEVWASGRRLLERLGLAGGASAARVPQRREPRDAVETSVAPAGTAATATAVAAGTVSSRR